MESTHSQQLIFKSSAGRKVGELIADFSQRKESEVSEAETDAMPDAMPDVPASVTLGSSPAESQPQLLSTSRAGSLMRCSDDNLDTTPAGGFLSDSMDWASRTHM